MLSTQQQLEKQTQDNKKLESELDKTKMQSNYIHTQIQKIDISELKKLQTLQKELQTKVKKIEGELPRDIYTNRNIEKNQESNPTPQDISRSIEDTLTDGKILRQKETHLLEQKNQIDKQKTERENRKKQLSKQVDIAQKTKQEQTIFKCDKISDLCPYVHLINKKATQALDTQITNASNMFEQHISTTTDRKAKLIELNTKLLKTQEDISSK